MGKLSVKHSSGNVPKTVLDLGTGSFSAACRNELGNDYTIEYSNPLAIILFNLYNNHCFSVEDALAEKSDQMTFDTRPMSKLRAVQLIHSQL